MVFKKAVWSSIAALFLLAAAAHAQSPAGTIEGRVIDGTGLPLPGVTVTVQGVDFTQTFTTDGQGAYRFLALAPGTYKLTTALDGFATNVRESVIVAIGQTVDLPVTLSIGSLTETVNVTAPSPMVDAKQTGM